MTNPIDDPKAFGNSVKINSRSPTKYKPMEMSDESVYDMALHQYTLDQIADRFNVTGSTVLLHHGEAFRAGKEVIPTIPRRLLVKIFKDFDQEDINFARMDVPTERLMKAMELYWKKYEGFGSKTELEVNTKEPVNASSFKFQPLTPENKDDKWVA